MTFEETLAEWMPSQRWFAGKGARILDLAVVSDTELVGGDPGLHQLIVTVTQSTGILNRGIYSTGIRSTGTTSTGTTSTGWGEPGPGSPGSALALGSTVDSYQLFLGL